MLKSRIKASGKNYNASNGLTAGVFVGVVSSIDNDDGDDDDDKDNDDKNAYASADYFTNGNTC